MAIIWTSVTLLSTSPVAAQAVTAQTTQLPPPVKLSLDDALKRAGGESEQVAIAEAGLRRARAEEDRARSEIFPQINASASYDRTLASEFAGLFGGGSTTTTSTCPDFSLNREAPLADRVFEIERALDCGGVGNLFSGGDVSLPFGRENIYRLNLSLAQTLFSGGRISAQRALAATGRDTADLELTSSRAQLALDVTEAFYNAVLSDRFVEIAESNVQQANATVALVELSRQAGRAPEFDLLRARVARDNLQPSVVRARSTRTLAYLRLKQLVELPPDATVQLEHELDDPVLPPPHPFAEEVANIEATRRVDNVESRVGVRQALAGVRASEAAVRIAKSERLPTVSWSSFYGRVAYPSRFPSFGDFRTNWTVGLAAQMPIFTGGRLRSDQVIAETRRVEAEQRLRQTRELALLDRQSAFEGLDAARAALDANAGTVAQAARANEIAELRFREGLSTQLELSDARLLLAQAQANRAQAARDLQVARARVALLPNLPLGSGSASFAGATSSAPAGADSATGGTGAATGATRTTAPAAGATQFGTSGGR